MKTSNITRFDFSKELEIQILQNLPILNVYINNKTQN